MPLFGSKKEKEKKPLTDKPSYPTQAKAAYPTQASAAAACPSYQNVGPEPPPAYTPVAYAQPQYPAPQYAAPGYASQPGYGYPSMAFLPVGYPQQLAGGPPQTVVVQGGFDAGARFDGTSEPSIPPPPPGCAPNAAQMAAVHGHNVVMTQQKSSIWTGGSDGGVTFF